MSPHQPPNILLVITDDQGIGDLGCHGNPVLKTPHLDAFARESLRLTNFHVGPTCAPTRAGLLTGRYCNCTGVWHTIMGRSLLRHDEITLATVLRNRGYATGLFGKWHLGDNYPCRPQDHGFTEAIYHRGGGIGQIPDYWENDYFDDTYFNRGQPENHSGYCTDVWFDLAKDFIRRHRQEPFFCYLATNAPHSPFQVPDSYAAPYRGAVPDERARFYGMISCIDERFGNLRAFLGEQQLDNDTIIIFLGDNGTAGGAQSGKDHFIVDGYNAGYRGVKNSPYDGGHRVPFFVRWPARQWSGGRAVNRLTANIDLMPTLLEACGVRATDSELHGKSLVPLFDAPAASWPDRVIITDSQRVDHPIKWRKSAVMTEQWRLVNGRELYDIESDPEQKNDIAPGNPDIVAKLRNDYEHWWEIVSLRMGEYIPIVIGSPEEPETVLTSHDCHGKEAETIWDQLQVRQGRRANGWWAVKIQHAGRYRLELRRWPREENLPIGEGMDGPVGRYNGGKALPIIRASLAIGTCSMDQSVEEGAVASTFECRLPAGFFRLKADFLAADQSRYGAYYVYVRPLGVAECQPAC